MVLVATGQPEETRAVLGDGGPCPVLAVHGGRATCDVTKERYWGKLPDGFVHCGFRGRFLCPEIWLQWALSFL